MSRLSFAFLFVALGCSLVLADETTKKPVAPAKAPSADEQKIRTNVQKYLKAYNNRDSQALVALWLPNGEYLLPEFGARLQGREAIGKFFEDEFKRDSAGKLDVEVRSIRFLSPNIAVEEGVATVTSKQGEPIRTEYSAVHVRHQKDWLLESVREHSPAEAPEAHKELKALAWLVGEWVDHGPGYALHTVTRWSDNGAFLTQSYNITIHGRTEMRGANTIGWDPVRKTIRSWAFDSNGGFAEGTWQHKDGRWLVHMQSTLPNGKVATATHVYRPIDANHFGWEATAREVDGRFYPNIEEVIVTRIVPTLPELKQEAK